MRERKGTISVLLFSLILTLIAVPSVVGFNISWISDTRLTVDEEFDGHPSIAQMRDGSIWVVWQSDRILNPKQNWKIMYKVYDGFAWSEDRFLPMNETWQNGKYKQWQWHDVTPSLLQTSDGAIWIFWATNRTGNFDILYKFTRNGGVSWSDEVPLTTSPLDDNAPAACQMVDGAVWVVWQRRLSVDSYNLYRKVSSDGGLSWSNETPLTTGLFLNKLPSIAQMRDGSIWVVWQSYRNGDFDIFYKFSSDMGATWSGDVRLTMENDVDTDPFVFQTIGGRIWVVYSSRQPVQNAQDDLYYKTSEDGVEWSVRVQLTTDSNDDMYAAMTQSEDRKIWIVWSSDRLYQPEIFYKTSSVLKGDVNEDGTVDIFDLALVSKSYGDQVGDPDFDRAADFNNDDLVDLWDLTIVAKNYGKTL